MARDQKDYYYRLAKQEGYRARSAYKLLQINEKFNIIKRGDSVVDLGAAPGGWLQVAAKLSGGSIVGVDLEGIAPIPGVKTFVADITHESTVNLVKDALGGEADVDRVRSRKGCTDDARLPSAPENQSRWGTPELRVQSSRP